MDGTVRLFNHEGQLKGKVGQDDKLNGASEKIDKKRKYCSGTEGTVCFGRGRGRVSRVVFMAHLLPSLWFSLSHHPLSPSSTFPSTFPSSPPLPLDPLLLLLLLRRPQEARAQPRLLTRRHPPVHGVRRRLREGL